MISLLHESLLQRLNKFNKELDNCRKHPSVDAVHDLRVAIRRLNSSLSFAKIFYSDKRFEQCKTELMSLMQPMGKLRDTHVQAEMIENLFTRIGPGLNEYLKLLWQEEKRQGKMALRVAVSFKPAACKKLLKIMNREDSEANSTDKLDAFFEKSNQLLQSRFVDVMAFSPQVVDPANLKALHQLRIAFKKYRYTIEIFRPLLTTYQATLLEQMQAFQSLLGDIHDLDVLIKDFKKFSQKKKRTKYETTNLKNSIRKLRTIRRQYFERFEEEFKAVETKYNPGIFLIEKHLAEPIAEGLSK